MPQDLESVRRDDRRTEQLAAVRIKLEHLLHLQRQAREAAPHVSVTTRQPDPDATRDRDHRQRLAQSAP